MLLRSTSRTARSKFAINHNGRYAPYTVTFRLGRDFRLVHIVNHNFVLPGNPLYHLNSLFAPPTSCTEHFNFLSHDSSCSQLVFPRSSPVLPLACGHMFHVEAVTSNATAAYIAGL